jgi:hypothetical protein
LVASGEEVGGAEHSEDARADSARGGDKVIRIEDFEEREDLLEEEGE